MTGAKNKTLLREKNCNRRAFRGQKERHPELEKRLCDYEDDRRQYGCTVTSEMCQLKALAVSKELGIMASKATLSLCQEAGSERVPAWLVAGIGTPLQWPMHIALVSTCVRLTVVTKYVQIGEFLQENLYFSWF